MADTRWRPKDDESWKKKFLYIFFKEFGVNS